MDIKTGTIEEVVFDYLMLKHFLDQGLLTPDFEYNINDLPLTRTYKQVSELIKMPEAQLLIHHLNKRVELKNK